MLGVDRSRTSYAVDLVSHLVAREFRLRYRNAALGWAWALGEPLVRLVVLAFVFTRVLPLGIPDYATFLFTGLIAWSWFSSAVLSAATSVVDRSDLILRPGVPRMVVPVVSVLTDGLDYVAALPVLVVFLLVGPGVSATIVVLPVLVAVQLLLMVGVGCLLATANVYLRDVSLLTTLALTLAFYLTPVFYSADEVPDRFQWLISLNPMARLIIAYRGVVVEGQLPDLVPFLALTAVAVAVAVVGCATYNRFSPDFADEL